MRIARSEAAKVLKKGPSVGPRYGNPLGIHDHVAEAGPHHCVACIVHVHQVDDVRVTIHRSPAPSKLLQGPGAEGREGDESARTEHAPRLPEDGGHVLEPVQDEIGDDQLGRAGGKGQAARTRDQGRGPGGPSDGGFQEKGATGGAARYDPRLWKACRQTIAETALRHEFDHPPGLEAHRVETVEEPLGGFRMKPLGYVGIPRTAGALRSLEHGSKKPCFPR